MYKQKSGNVHSEQNFLLLEIPRAQEWRKNNVRFKIVVAVNINDNRKVDLTAIRLSENKDKNEGTLLIKYLLFVILCITKGVFWHTW